MGESEIFDVVVTVVLSSPLWDRLSSNKRIGVSQSMNLSKLPLKTALTSFVALVVCFSSLYTIEEGHVGIVKRFSEAKAQVGPGLHFKAPFIDSIEELEVRTRKNEERMPSSTHEQMPVTVHVSVNWTVDRAAALDLYTRYGGLEQFESRILDPRFRSATKDVIPHYTAEQLIQDRATAISNIEENLVKEMGGFPVKVDNVQIENVQLPAKYIESIQLKQREKNLAAAEEHKLARQKLEAMRDVNTAEAARDAEMARADGAAYAIEVQAIADAEAIAIKGTAEAKAIKAKAAALKSNPLIVELTKAQAWDGALPKTVLGDGQNLLLNMK